MSKIHPFSWPDGVGEIHLFEELERVSRQEIEQVQSHNLANMVAATVVTPSIHQRFPDIELVTNMATLARLPLMSPEDLAKSCPPYSDELLLAGGGPGIVMRSSGTSGRRKVLYHSWLFNRQAAWLGVRGVRSALHTTPQRLINCMPAGSLGGSFVFVQDIGQLLPALTFPCSSTLSTTELAEVISEHKADALVSGPVLAVDLFTRNLHPASLRTVLYLGEAMGEEHTRMLTAIAPNLVIRSLSYAATETGPIGYQCTQTHGTTHHIHEDAVIVEVVDEYSGLPVADDSPGELVVTPLTSTGMALFRYRIGDRGRLHSAPCPCGSVARLLTLDGRVGQSITVDIHTVSDNLLMHLLGELEIYNPLDCQFQVLWSKTLTYEVHLLLASGVPRGLTNEQVSRTLCNAHHMNAILRNPRCTAFTIAYTERSHFAQSERGKLPLFYQANS